LPANTINMNLSGQIYLAINGSSMKNTRTIQLHNAPLQYAPENELGVVFLFSQGAKKLQFRVEQIRPQYPDCIAYRKIGNLEKRVRIEFEYKSSNFRSHKHDPKDCDCIICWHHDWPGAPKHLEIIELKRHFGVGVKIWIQPAVKSQWFHLDGTEKLNWALSKRTTPGDFLLMYRCVPEKSISEIFRFTGELGVGKAEWLMVSAILVVLNAFATLIVQYFLMISETIRF